MLRGGAYVLPELRILNLNCTRYASQEQLGNHQKKGHGLRKAERRQGENEHVNNTKTTVPKSDQWDSRKDQSVRQEDLGKNIHSNGAAISKEQRGKGIHRRPFEPGGE